jgi:hypothetical protein
MNALKKTIVLIGFIMAAKSFSGTVKASIAIDMYTRDNSVAQDMIKAISQEQADFEEFIVTKASLDYAADIDALGEMSRCELQETWK